MRRYTYADAIEHLLDYTGGVATVSDGLQRDAKRAIQSAYRDLINAHRWSFLLTHGRINTNAAYATGTIAYTHTGGAYERVATLTGGTWPTWAGSGAYLRISTVTYRVDERKSATQLTLTETLNPGADVAALTAYTLYRDTYVLPEDFIAQDESIYENNFGGMSYVAADEWLYRTRLTYSTGAPAFYTFTGDPQFPGRLVMRIFPFPDQSATIDFVYYRRPRNLLVDTVSSGTWTVTSGDTSAVGSGTAATSSMVGSVLRFGTTSILPTGLEGSAPAVFETLVKAVASTSAITLTDAADAAYASVKGTISDPVDLEPGVMLTAFLRGCEKQMAIARTTKDKPNSFNAYDMALREAKAADSRSFAERAVGGIGPRRQQVKNMPLVM